MNPVEDKINKHKAEQNPSRSIMSLVMAALTGCVLTVAVYSWFIPKVTDAEITQSVKDKPLYWVAPMDANYRRDKPGKSPMGMDLVPVFDDVLSKTNNGNGADEGVGTIRIAANVVNNLGVRTAKVSYKSLKTEITTVGYITYDEDKLVHIHPRVQGWIEKLHVKTVGDPVIKGQALYEIYSPELVNAQEEFLLALERGNDRLIYAAQNRLVALQIPKSTINELKKTQQVQQRIIFYAPQNGVVENLKIREGFFVKPGSTIMSIGDLSEVWVEGELFERQAGQVKTGTAVTMTLDYLPGQAWQGQVDYIYPMLDPNTRTVKVRLRFNNENGNFKPNMFAQLVLHTQGDDNTLLIPREALIRTGTQDRVVLALGEGSYKSITVKVGRYDSENVEILAGLNDGEYVVSSAQFLLDSESSKSSDFKRMEKMSTSKDESTKDQKPDTATVKGKVNSLMAEHGMINISRDAIKKWGRPAATLDFIADEDVSLIGINVNDEVEFTFEIHDGNFVITSITTLTPDMFNNKSEVHPSSVDHSNH